MKTKILSITIVITLLIAVYSVQVHIDQISGKMSKAKSLSLLPKGELLKTVSLGYSSVIADLLWLEVVQAIGEKRTNEADYPWIYHAADVVTTLDPKFEYSYEIAGIALDLGQQFELSNQILLKGVKNNPDDWKIPYYLGFNYFFYLNDYPNAAKYMSLSATLPGHSAYLPGLAARLYVEAKDPSLALEFLKNTYQDTKDESVKQQIETRIREVMIERDILLLNKAMESYTQKYKKRISSLSDLVSSKYIDKIPDEPFDGYYFYDSVKKTVQSSTHPERMKVYRKS